MKVQSYSIIIIVYLQLEHSHTSGMIVYQYLHTQYNDTIAGIAHTKSYPSHNILALNIHKIDARLDFFLLLDIEILGMVVREKGVSDCCSKQTDNQ